MAVRIDFFVNEAAALELTKHLSPKRDFDPSYAAKKIVLAALERERRRRARLNAKRDIAQAARHAGL